jgi:ankyrin repeat protein
VREQVETTIGDWLGITHFGQQYNMHQHFDKQLSLHLNGTCEWIFDRSEYREWESGLSLDENSKFLWIHGPAGHGKSVISAHLIKHLKSMAHYGVGFFFCSSHAASAGSLSYIIRSWIYQIARSHSDALDLVQGFTQRSEVRRTAPDTEIWLVFQSLISQPFNLVFFLDGLDEYPQSNDNRVDFLHRLKQVSAKTATRFLITSREEVDIKAMLSPADQSKGQILLEYRISAKDVKNDVILYSKSIVDRKLPNKNEKLRTKLANQLADKCDGMFLWVKMQQEHLNSYKNGKQLEKIVGEMPIELNEVYEKSWETINRSRPDAREQAVAILRWASFAERPLTVSEISEALFIETDGDQVGLQLDELPDAIDEAYINDGIIGICCSLVEVRARDSEIALGSRTIHLIHPSVREFLSFVMIGNANVTFPQPFMDQLDQSSQHGLLARICLAYLNDKRIWDSADEERHFLNYAATSWHSHFKYSEKSDHQISSLVSQFFESSNESFKTWAKYYEKTQQSSGYEYQDIGTPMYYAALFSLLPTMEAIWRRDPSQLNAVGGRYGTPMQAACATGNKTAFDMLIAWGADPNVNAGQFGSALTAAASLNLKDAIVTLIDKGAQLELKDPDGRTALSTSARDGHVEVVRLLLEHGAETTIVNKYGWTPVNSAAHDGHAEVIGLLLDHGADMNTGNKEGGKTPIYTAADRGFPDVVRLLLERGADVANQNDSGWTPVFAAATNGHTEVVRLLLDRGADAATPGSDEWTPMNSAASWGYEEIIKLLLERGADPGIPNNKGWVPLATGVLNGHLEIARLFLDRGTDANIQDNEGNTSLYFAARAGHIKIVQLLLERGADPTISNNKSLTPVLVAAWNGHVETVRELLDRGANINTQDSDGDTPLGLAARDGHTEVVRLLISRGAHINMPNNDGVTPLFFAASGGFVSVVHQLLEHGAEVNISRTDRFGPLHTAAENGSIEVVRQLLDGGAKVNATGKFELTALHLAARQGHIDIASLLLQEGANINITEADNWTSLHNAARNGHVETVSLLLKEGANAYSADNDGWTPLHLATRYGHVEMVSILLKDGANANSADNAGWTPLHLATRYGHVETVSLLLKEGANADSVDNDGWTPLHQAANQGHVDIVGLLIQAGAHSMPLAKPEKMYTNDLTAPDAFFQRSALSMAARSGHKSIVKLLLQNYAETGQRVRDEDAKIVANPDEDYRSYVGCDRCGNHILDTAPYFHCMSCIDGRFDVCQACFDASILCLDSTHKLIKRVYALDGY